MHTFERPPRVWTINGDFTGLNPNGVARYGREVTIAIDRLVGSGHPLTQGLKLNLVCPQKPVGFALANIPVRIVKEYSYPRLPQVWSQAQLPRFVKGGLLSFSNLAPVAVRRHVVCIHDLHTFLMPESYGKGFRFAHRVILPALGRMAERITTVSNFSKSCLVDYKVAPENKITVTYNGCDHAKAWDRTKATIAIGPRPFALFLGQRQPYKNAQLVWQIAPDLDKLGLDIYVAGDLADDAIQALSSALPSNIRLLGRVSDHDLAALFDAAICFLFPSRIEGFGIPMMEAMVHGCPVIASNAPCMPEIAGDAALYAGPDDASGWIAHVARLNAEPELRAAMREQGLERAKLYTWQRVAETYLQIMHELDGAKAP